MTKWILAPALLTTGCFQVTQHPICTEVAVTEVADDEGTPSGTAAEVLDLVELDAVLPGYWQDDSSTELEVWVARGSGPATWVEVEADTEETRSWGFGTTSLTLGVSCEDQLRVPLEATVASADGTLWVPVSGVAATPMPFEPVESGSLRVQLEGTFADASFPESQNDPDDFTDHISFVNLSFREGALDNGAAGWGGHQETEDASRAIAEYVVTFGAIEG